MRRCSGRPRTTGTRSYKKWRRSSLRCGKVVAKNLTMPKEKRSSLSRREFLAGSAGTTATLVGAAITPAAAQAAPCTPDDPNGGSKSKHITSTVAEWVVNSRYADIPSQVRKEAVRSVVNSVAATMGGSADPAVAIALRTLKPFSGPGTASLFGRPDRLSPLLRSGFPQLQRPRTQSRPYVCRPP